MKTCAFKVKVPPLKLYESVCVIGNQPQLGSWQPQKAVPLQPKGNGTWSLNIELPISLIEYRYCICLILNPGIKLIIKSWETFLAPRVLDLTQEAKPQTDTYGIINSSTEQISRGWLTSETLVHLKLLNSSLNIWSHTLKDESLYLKIIPIDVSGNSSAPKTGTTDVGVLFSDDPAFKPQSQFGCPINHTDDFMILYETLVQHTDVIAFQLEFYLTENGDSFQSFGVAYVTPKALNASEGSVVVPITSTRDNQPLGEIGIDYLIVKPSISMGKFCNMATTYSNYWNQSTKGLHVGHRGSGNSFSKNVRNCSDIRENTIASFQKAIDHGADYIEFDVQLSQDLVPVVFHDFNVCISTKRKIALDGSLDVVKLPVEELTYEQLQILKLFHVTEGKSLTQKLFDENLADHQPFPKLEQILKSLDPNVGFNIEIKRPLKKFKGSYEKHSPLIMDINVYLDTILDVVFRYAGERRIIFSCFNPDICVAIRMKQNRYPVLLLTAGEYTLSPPKYYNDPRSWSVKSAVQSAKMFGFLGVCANIKNLLISPNLVKLAVNSDLVLFCYGDEAADPLVINQMKELGIHGVIYDKMYQHSDKEIKKSVFLVKAKSKQ